MTESINEKSFSGVRTMEFNSTSVATVTRTADTNAYGAGDVIGAATGSTAALTFAEIGEIGSHIVVLDADLRIDINAVPSGMTSFKLHLYNVTPPSALGDNAVFNLPAGDRASYLGYIDLGTPVDQGDTLFVQTAGTGSKQIKMGATTSLFGYLVTTGAYTPSSGDVFTVRLNVKSV